MYLVFSTGSSGGTACEDAGDSPTSSCRYCFYWSSFMKLKSWFKLVCCATSRPWYWLEARTCLEAAEGSPFASLRWLSTAFSFFLFYHSVPCFAFPSLSS